MYRVSSEEQRNEGWSLQSQKRRCHSYNERAGIVLTREWECAESAWKPDRKLFAEFVAHVNSDDDIVAMEFESPDRMARNLYEYLTLEEMVKEDGREIHFFGTAQVYHQDSTARDWKALREAVVDSAFYSDNQSEKVRAGLDQKAEEGHWPGRRFFMTTFNHEKHIVEIDRADPGLPVFVRMAHLYATAQYSLDWIVEEAHRQGLRSRRDSKICKQSWANYLSDVRYTGLFRWNGKLRKGSHGALWDGNTHRALLLALARDGKPTGCASVGKPDHAFAKMGVCKSPTCPKPGTTVTVVGPQKANPEYVYYFCPKCGKPRPSIRQDRLAAQLGARLHDLEFPPDIVAWVRDQLQSSHAAERDEREARIRKLEADKQRLRYWTDRAYERHLNGKLSEEDYERREADWTAQMDEADRQLLQLRVQDDERRADGIRVLELAQAAARLYEAADYAEKAEILKIVTQNFTWDGVSAEPVWAEPFDGWVEMAESENWSG